LGGLPLSPPASVPSSLREQERALLARLRSAMAAETQGSRLALESQMATLEVELTAIWEQMAKIAPAYVALRQGEPVSYRQVTTLFKGP
jgi:uncharacterized protein YdeI (YjbR/CyaY-like superfamily)